MLDFALKVCLASKAVGEAGDVALQAHGFSEKDAWHIAAITAYFGLSNRRANVMGMPPNDDAYQLMGPVQRA
jgi:alkylhydroperoxidase family enzyme